MPFGPKSDGPRDEWHVGDADRLEVWAALTRYERSRENLKLPAQRASARASQAAWEKTPAGKAIHKVHSLASAAKVRADPARHLARNDQIRAWHATRNEERRAQCTIAALASLKNDGVCESREFLAQAKTLPELIELTTIDVEAWLHDRTTQIFKDLGGFTPYEAFVIKIAGPISGYLGFTARDDLLTEAFRQTLVDDNATYRQLDGGFLRRRDGSFDALGLRTCQAETFDGCLTGTVWEAVGQVGPQP